MICEVPLLVDFSFTFLALNVQPCSLSNRAALIKGQIDFLLFEALWIIDMPIIKKNKSMPFVLLDTIKPQITNLIMILDFSIWTQN